MNIFISGATGFMGRQLASVLMARHHTVKALVRKESEGKLPANCPFVTGNPLKAQSFVKAIPPADTFVHLVGVTHPSPTKTDQFRTIDLASAKASVDAAKEAGVKHFVYLSVASPAPIMQSYISARLEGESLIRLSGMNATIVKPWYVIGPGRRWPLVIAPVYWILERIPATHPAAERLGFVSLNQIVAAMVRSIESPPTGIRVLDVPSIRKA